MAPDFACIDSFPTPSLLNYKRNRYVASFVKWHATCATHLWNWDRASQFAASPIIVGSVFLESQFNV